MSNINVISLPYLEEISDTQFLLQHRAKHHTRECVARVNVDLERQAMEFAVVINISIKVKACLDI